MENHGLKQPKKLVAAVLMLSLLLSLFGGGFASAAGPQTVTTDEELVYEPLAQTASVAYEEHEDGYTVALDRAADSVTLYLRAVPRGESDRAPEKAQLFIRTGVALKANTVYQVSFSLSAENAQPEYAVSFDGGSAKGAYGALDGRSIEAGGQDQVKYLITPKMENGELVLRLMLGKTEAEGNTFRFSNLEVGEASGDENQSGESVLLADNLDYNVGAVSMWANTGSKAEITSNGKSVTLSVLEKPAKGTEVWEIQLKIATGVRPEPGKIYRVNAVLSATTTMEYELCFNEGDVEKGYDALYGQWLSEGRKNISHRIIAPSDKENPGELVVQFALGKLGVGDSATISGITVEEVFPQYINALAHDFTYDETWISEKKDQKISRAFPLETNVNWSGAASVSAGGDYSGGVTVDGGKATLKINAGSVELWDAYMQIDTGELLKAGTTYKVSYKVDSANAYSGDMKAEILCGSGQGEGGDRNYDAKYGYSLAAGANTVIHQFTTAASGGLLIKLQLGQTGGAANTVTMSELKIEELVAGATVGDELAAVVYPSADTSSDPVFFVVRDPEVTGGSLTGDGSSVTMTRGTLTPGDGWRHGLSIGKQSGGIYGLKQGKSYQVSYDIQVTEGAGFDFKSHYIWDDRYAGDQEFFARPDLPAPADEAKTYVETITPDKDCALYIFLEFGAVKEGTVSKVKVSNVTVKEVTYDEAPTGGELAAVTYPSADVEDGPSNGIFEVRDAGDTGGLLSGDGDAGDSVIMTRGTKQPDKGWTHGLFIGKDNYFVPEEEPEGIATLTAGKRYELSFELQVVGGTESDFYFKATCYGDSCFGDRGGIEIGSKDGNAVMSPQTVTYRFEAPTDCELLMFIELGASGSVSSSKVKISKISVYELDSVPSYGPDLAGVVYPSGTPVVSSFSIRTGENHTADEVGRISGDEETYAELTCLGGTYAQWLRGLLVKNFCTHETGGYRVSIKLVADRDIEGARICFNKNEDWANDLEGEHTLYMKEDVGFTAGVPRVFTGDVSLAESDSLILRADLGTASPGTKVRVSEISVYEIGYDTVSTKNIDTFTTSAVWVETGTCYEADLARSKDRVDLAVRKTISGTLAATWKAKLIIDTGVPYEAGKGYRVSFDISSPVGLEDFCAIYNTPDETYNGRFGEKLSANDTKTVVSEGLPAGNGNVQVTIELGNFKGRSNSFTVSNVQVEELELDVFIGDKDDGTVNFDSVGGYKAELVRYEKSATLNVTQIPAEGAEIWKLKLFVLTGVQASKDEAYRVTFDLLSEDDMDFEVCYNRDGDEKGYSALYGQHAEGGKVLSVEKSFFATEDGALNLQVSLGLTRAMNKITINNLKVERITSNSSKNMTPAGVNYREPSAVSFWSHEDYDTTFTGSDNAVTAKITGAPEVGAEPWKIKLFLDTGTALEPGKNYKVTARVSAAAAQAYEICYNNGGVEMGYDSMGGLQLAGGGAVQTVERIVSVPADKTGLENLMLQFNLGKTSSPNEITVSGVTVEEVPVSYTEVMDKDFVYTGSAVDLWTYTDYTAELEGSDDAATAHITAASDDPAVWKVKLFVNTGVILSPGRTYLVSADLLAAKAQKFEVCYNNEETEKGYDAIYDQPLAAGSVTTVEHNISVPASMTDAGELVLQFAVGGAVTNDITVSNVSVQEIDFGTGGGGTPAPDTVVGMYNAAGTAAGTLAVTREKLSYAMTKISAVRGDNAITVAGANLRGNDLYTVTFKARADKEMTGVFMLRQKDDGTAPLYENLTLTTAETPYTFTLANPLAAGGYYDLVWQFGSESNQRLGGAEVEISDISVSCPSETLAVARSGQRVTVNGTEVTADIYSINGYNYFKLRDLAMMLNSTDAQFVIRYNPKTNATSLTTGKVYTPVGGELELGADQSASCARSAQNILINGASVNLKAYDIGGNNYFRLRDLSGYLGFKVEYLPESDTAAITSPPTPEAQENAHAYDIFFLPEVDGEAQPYVGDTMPYYEDGVYYIYYLKEGGDAFNHSVYLATTTDFVTYTEQDDPVLTASREDVQDNWIGTGSVVKVENTYYFFYTGFNASGSQEYHEKIMVAASSSPTSFEKVRGWEIVPPDELGQKNDFRDPQAYYDPDTQTISLTVTASQGGTARILKYTLDKDLKNARYDGIIFTDPTGRYWNLECSDTFRIGDKWYLTYSGQDDTLWYAMADSRFGPYSNAARLDGRLFYAAKHVEDGSNSYMVGWARRSGSASSTEEVSGWAGNVVVQKLSQQADGSLVLVPVDGIVSSFAAQKELALGASEATVTAGEGYSYEAAFTSGESFLLSGEFTYSGEGTFGLAFDFNGDEEQYKLISINPAADKLSLSFNGGATTISETQVALQPGQKYAFTYIQDGSVGVFYLDGQASLVVRLYGVTDKPVYLFAENNSVTFTSLRQCVQA